MIDVNRALEPPDLKIERIKTVPIRVPLDRVYKGSPHQMGYRSRSSVASTRPAASSAGHYAGDEDDALADLDRVIHREIARRWSA